MRKHYLDNIRTVTILLLFPYHTFMIWNNFGPKFYIWGGNNIVLSSVIVSLSPWLMPVLFVIAGMSAKYSLGKRSTKEFIKERTKRLLLPLISALIILVPFQTLYARKFFFQYDKGIIDNFKYFFTHFSDLNGYDGMFTFGHLWFLLYLFIITLITLPLVKKIPHGKIKDKINRINIFLIIFLFIPVFLFYHIGNFGGQSIGKYLLLYLIGYYIFTDENIEKIIKMKSLILSLFLISQVTLVFLYAKYGYYEDLFVNFTGWLGILSCIILGNKFLNKENKITFYFRKSSFSIYILHQTILVITAYYSLRAINNIFLQVITIIFGSFALTLLSFEIIKRIPFLRKLIGVK